METKTVAIGDGLANIRVPETYASEIEEDNTVQVYQPGQEDIILRFTALTLTPKDEAVRDSGVQFVANDAKEGEHELTWLDDERCLYETEEDSDEEGDDSRFIFWHLGYGNTVFIISADIDDEHCDAPHVVECLERVPEIIQSIIFAPYERREEIETAYGKIHVKAKTYENDDFPAQQYAPFCSERQIWLEGQYKIAKKLCDHYSQELVRDAFDPKNLDFVFKRWMNDASDGKPGDELVANALGAGFGDYLCRTLNMTWIVVNDESGEAVAVRHNGPSDTIAYPIHSVLKRIKLEQVDFFENIVEVLRRSIEKGTPPSG